MEWAKLTHERGNWRVASYSCAQIESCRLVNEATFGRQQQQHSATRAISISSSGDPISCFSYQSILHRATMPTPIYPLLPNLVWVLLLRFFSSIALTIYMKRKEYIQQYSLSRNVFVRGVVGSLGEKRNDWYCHPFLFLLSPSFEDLMIGICDQKLISVIAF